MIGVGQVQYPFFTRMLASLSILLHASKIQAGPGHLPDFLLFNHAMGVRLMEAHLQLHQAYTHDISSHSTYIHQTARFAQGDYRLDNKISSGRPIDVLRKLIDKSLYQTTHQLWKDFRCHYLTTRRKLIALGKGQKIFRRQPLDRAAAADGVDGASSLAILE